MDYGEKEIKELKEYCYKYLERNYDTKDYIKRTKITKNGLFIYGHKVYDYKYDYTYTIYTFINKYDCKYYEYINSLLDHFVIDCKRLREC